MTAGYVERTPSYAEYMFSVFYRYMMMLQYFKNDPSLREKYWAGWRSSSSSLS